MINVGMPQIIVEKVKNGYIVIWDRPATPDELKDASHRRYQMVKIAFTQEELLICIAEAAEDVSVETKGK